MTDLLLSQNMSQFLLKFKNLYNILKISKPFCKHRKNKNSLRNKNSTPRARTKTKNVNYQKNTFKVKYFTNRMQNSIH